MKKAPQFTSYHVSISVEKGLELILKGKNIFSGTPVEAYNALINQRSKGKKYYTGCGKENKEGQCRGHVSRKPKTDKL